MRSGNFILIWFTVVLLICAVNLQSLFGAVTDGLIQLDKTEWKDYKSSSGSFISSEKEEYTYDENGKVETITSYVWDQVNENWIGTEKTWNVYDDTLLTEVLKSYPGADEIWIDTQKKVFSYTNGLKTEVIIFERSANNQPWGESERELLTYDAKGNLTEALYQEWNILKKSWSSYLIENMLYDDDNRITGYTSKVWDFIFDDWVNYDKEEYMYGTNPVSESYFYYVWNESSNTWDTYYKDYSEYTADMMNKGFLSWYWENGLWIELTKEIHEFDAQNHLVYYAEYDWNAMSKRWDYYDKETYSYDDNGNLTVFVDYDRQETKNTWIEHSRELYSYNTGVRNEMLVLPFTDQSIIDLYFNSQIMNTRIYYWDAASSTWKDDQLGEFSYSDFTVSDALQNNTLFQSRCYPNPVSEKFFVETEEGIAVDRIELYSLSGQLLENWNFYDAEGYNIKHLSVGTYLIIVHSEDSKSFVSKLVKY
ncbi:T9SS type A sorting domain-containing protein [Saccharicrinis sp. FJH54]|uniref:T9SS type A sorting domain-containing protein n=1 Tax=Saccharicrinis sp. FJH54 TaxID=3344665 RepID=UPI0035D42009